MTSHIAEVSRQRTGANVELKLSVLKGWVTSEIPWLKNVDGKLLFDQNGERKLDFFPKTIVEFAKWNGSENCRLTRVLLPAITSMSPSTLHQGYHSSLKIKVEAALQSIVNKASLQVTSKNKHVAIQTLSVERDYLNALAIQQDLEILELRQRHSKNEIELRATNRALEANIAEHDRVVSVLQAQIASLTNQISKVLPMHRKSAS